MKAKSMAGSPANNDRRKPFCPRNEPWHEPELQPSRSSTATTCRPNCGTAVCSAAWIGLQTKQKHASTAKRNGRLFTELPSGGRSTDEKADSSAGLQATGNSLTPLPITTY